MRYFLVKLACKIKMFLKYYLYSFFFIVGPTWPQSTQDGGLEKRKPLPTKTQNNLMINNGYYN